jgi:hypothetical protein
MQIVKAGFLLTHTKTQRLTLTKVIKPAPPYGRRPMTNDQGAKPRDTQNTAPEKIWLNVENENDVFPNEVAYLRADVAQAMVAAALEKAAYEVAELAEHIAEERNDRDRATQARAIAKGIRALIKDPSILAKRDAQIKAEGLREAAGLIKPPKFCLPDQVGRVEAMHEMRHAILARADEIEKGEG